MAVRCPFSNLEPLTSTAGFENIRYSFEAPRAGGRYCTKQGFSYLVEEVNRLGDRGKARVVTLLVDERRAGEEEPELNIDLIKQAERKPDLSLDERAWRLLEFFIAESDGLLGRAISICGDKVDPMLAWVESRASPDLLLSLRIESSTKREPFIPQEIKLLCEHLERQELISYADGDDLVYVTGKGYSEMEEGMKAEGTATKSGEDIVREDRQARRVFVVHGHDDGPKQAVARLSIS